MYEAMRTGARMALMCLEPGTAKSVQDVRKTVRDAHGRDDPRMVFHLNHLVFIGLAEQKPLGQDQIGYEMTELGIRASNQMPLPKKRERH